MVRIDLGRMPKFYPDEAILDMTQAGRRAFGKPFPASSKAEEKSASLKGRRSRQYHCNYQYLESRHFSFSYKRVLLPQKPMLAGPFPARKDA
jgi:hypothetical protein